MGEFKLAAGVLHIALLTPHMTLLVNAQNVCDSKTATGWTNLQSTTRLVVTSALLHHHYFLLWYHAVTARISYLPGDNNVLAGATSHRWYITALTAFLMRTSHSGTPGESYQWHPS